MELFLAVQTQWRRGPDGRPVGLDYQAITIAAGVYGVDLGDVFWRVQALEQEWVAALMKAGDG